MPPAAEQAAPAGVEAAAGVGAAAQPPPAARAPPAADAVAAPGEGLWEDCEVCEQCVLGEPPSVRAPACAALAAWDRRGPSAARPAARHAAPAPAHRACLRLRADPDAPRRAALLLRRQSVRLEPPADKRCKKCYGCSVILTRLPSHDNVMGKNRVARALARLTRFTRAPPPPHAP